MNSLNFSGSPAVEAQPRAKKQWKVIVEMDFFKIPGLTVYEKLVYTLLCGFADADGASFPSAETLASLAGCSARQWISAGHPSASSSGSSSACPPTR